VRIREDAATATGGAATARGEAATVGRGRMQPGGGGVQAFGAGGGASIREGGGGGAGVAFGEGGQYSGGGPQRWYIATSDYDSSLEKQIYIIELIRRRRLYSIPH
jgi:hypothetical protein